MLLLEREVDGVAEERGKDGEEEGDGKNNIYLKY